MANPNPNPNPNSNPKPNPKPTLKVAHPKVTALAFDASGRRLLTGAQDGLVRVWNFSSGQCLRECLPPTQGDVPISADLAGDLPGEMRSSAEVQREISSVMAIQVHLPRSPCISSVMVMQEGPGDNSLYQPLP